MSPLTATVCLQGMTLKGRTSLSRESANVGEAVLLPMAPSPADNSSRPSTEATTSFDMSTSSYEPYQSTGTPTGSHGFSFPVCIRRECMMLEYSK